MDSYTLNELEHAVMEKLLAGDSHVLETLRRQARGAKVVRRENTGAGFYTWLEPSSDSPRTPDPGNFELSDVEAQIPGLTHGAGFVLFIRNGYLDNLEGFSYDEPWPKEIVAFSLK
ncbi:MAG: hypothetical protein SF066_20275 [Thermoanaerobaculia bacterium]|nr:hypothetical protein [Thermoanaerobaculia bacterium]